jgi:23S rRNA (adenine2503-C2)-methyltransferase
MVTAAPVLALQAFTPRSLVSALDGSVTEDEARKIVAAVHRGVPLDEIAPAGVRRAARQAVRARGAVPTLEVRSVQCSELDPFVKLALATADGRVVEAVRIPLERTGRFSACVSSQVGCALACAFCATGRLGLSRNLETWEIVEQVRMVHSTLAAQPQGTPDGPLPPHQPHQPLRANAPGRLEGPWVAPGRVHGVVFQGMGEPLANADRVFEAIRVLCEPSALAIDARAMTVCTSGLPTGIRRLARELPRVRLGVSIASARPDVRRRLMPIDEAHPLDEVIDAVEEHARVTGLAPMWAVTPLGGVSDSEADAAALAQLARRFEARTGIRPRVSVIPYNAIDEGERDPFRRGDVARFVAALGASGIRPHLRYSGGSDVAAACGQLAARA